MLKEYLKLIIAAILSRLYNLSFNRSNVSSSFKKFQKAFSESSHMMDYTTIADEPWLIFEEEIKQTVLDKPRYWFFNIRIIRNTMTGVRPFSKYNKLDESISYFCSRKLLKFPCVDDPVGGPIPNLVSSNITSIERKIHYYQACCVASQTTLSNKVIVEWGGGYGGLASILMRHDPTLTYVIIDLPSVLRLQYMYLCAVLERTKVHYAAHADDIKKSCINLIDGSKLIDASLTDCHIFISNWAVSETHLSQQKEIIERDFFSAENIIIMHQPNSITHPYATFIADFLMKSDIYKTVSKQFPSLPQQQIIFAAKVNG